MAPNDKAGRVVFIGNIPYGVTEEQICEILKRVGEIAGFRLVYDKETGRPKGFGFAQFLDADAAASAVRNLNDYEIMGRKLRVDWSNDNGAGDNATTDSSAAPINGQAEAPFGQQTSSVLPPLPPGADLQPNLTCPDAISRTLSTLPAAQLLDILSQMKGLVMTDPAKATELLSKAPQLSYAIFQALLLLNLVDTTILGTIVEHSGGPAASTPATAPTPSLAPSLAPPLAQPTQSPAPPSQRPQYPGFPPQPTPPNPTPQYQPPQLPVAQPSPLNDAQLIQVVMAMPQAQIDALPPDQRAQIMAVRQAAMAQGRAF